MEESKVKASMVEAKGKTLVASQFKILDIARPLLYWWGSTTYNTNLSTPFLSARPSQPCSDGATPSTISQLRGGFKSLLAEFGRFRPKKCALLFGRTFLWSMVRDASDGRKLKSLGHSGVRPSTAASSSWPSRSSGSTTGSKSGRSGSRFQPSRQLQ